MSSPRSDGATNQGTTSVVETISADVAVTETIMYQLDLRDRPNITWSEDTIDNENLGRRSSKRCCIFHKVKKFGESDSDETASEDEDEDENDKKDGEEGEGNPKKIQGVKKVVKNYQRHHA